MLRDRERERVVITGASAGIGRALAVQYARTGADVAILARRVERLEKLARQVRESGGRALVVACDVRDEAQMKSAIAQVEKEWGGVDVLIANAGYGVVGRFEDLGIDDFRRQFETNVFGVVNTVHAALPALKRTRGRLALVGSIKGTIVVPGGSAYAMSKFAVKALALALDAELRASGVSVTHVAPGYIKTEFRNVDNYGRETTEALPHTEVPEWFKMSAEDCARHIHRAVRARRFECVVTGHGKFLVWLFRHFPALFRYLVVKTQKSPRSSR